VGKTLGRLPLLSLLFLFLPVSLPTFILYSLYRYFCSFFISFPVSLSLLLSPSLSFFLISFPILFIYSHFLLLMKIDGFFFRLVLNQLYTPSTFQLLKWINWPFFIP